MATGLAIPLVLALAAMCRTMLGPARLTVTIQVREATRKTKQHPVGEAAQPAILIPVGADVGALLLERGPSGVRTVVVSRSYLLDQDEQNNQCLAEWYECCSALEILTFAMCSEKGTCRSGCHSVLN